MSNPWVVLVTTVVIIVLSAFFVAIEFALIAAKRHRLEDAAVTSRAARAALRSSSELTMLLAGSQLGITVCALALGAITKPAVHHWLTPMFETWNRAPWVADVAGFVLALVIVTFLHLVIGEMAPKSWAIAHPERSATLLAIPMRGFMWLVRPLLHWLNKSANWCLRRVGVEPSDQVTTTQNPDTLRALVEHSANVGALDAAYSAQLSGALDLQHMTLADLVSSGREPVCVPAGSTVADVQGATRGSGHLRILVGDPVDVQGVVHVRDTLEARSGESIVGFIRPVLQLAHTTPVHTALATMRETRNHLVVVDSGDGARSVVTMSDVLRRLFPQRPLTCCSVARQPEGVAGPSAYARLLRKHRYAGGPPPLRSHSPGPLLTTKDNLSGCVIHSVGSCPCPCPAGAAGFTRFTTMLSQVCRTMEATVGRRPCPR